MAFFVLIFTCRDSDCNLLACIIYEALFVVYDKYPPYPDRRRIARLEVYVLAHLFLCELGVGLS